MEYEVRIKTESPLCLNSGKADVNVDADIVHDALGLPYFPGKRLRGLLYESAVEVVEMAELCEKNFVERKTVEEVVQQTRRQHGRTDRPQFSPRRLSGYGQRMEVSSVYFQWTH